MAHAPADRPSDAASTDEWPVRNAALGDPHAPAYRPSDAASTDASSLTTPTDPPPTTETWPLLEKPALPPAATESRWERWGGAPAPDAVVVAQAVGRFEAVRKNVREAAEMAIAWGMIAGVFGLTVLDEEDFWSDATRVGAIAATSRLWCSL